MKERPNIILIITDQQRYDTISALGFDHCITPNLDKLVAGGTTFEQCHVTAASCAPARASLFTGYYPHSTGILKTQMTGLGVGWKFSQTGAITAPISAKCTHGLSLRLAVSMSVMSLRTKIDFLKVLNLRMSGRVICKMRASKNKARALPKKR